jgi:FkbM family methyltransferase
VRDVPFGIIVGVGDGDPISENIAAGAFSYPSSFHLPFALLEPGLAVLDLGAHIGTFSLAAAALGCRVVAVEASPHNAALLRTSVAFNGFEQMTVVSAAVTDHQGTLEFIQSGPYGVVANPSVQSSTVQVRAVTVDGLLEELGWDRVDLIKMDVEGSEVSAIRGMAQLLARADAPLLVYESNGFTLGFFGETPNSLLATLEGFGYRNYVVEPGQLLPVSSEELQAECLVDYFALKTRPAKLRDWQIRSPRTYLETVSQVVSACSHPVENHCVYTARALCGADPSILSHPEVRLAMKWLARDPSAAVRDAASWWTESADVLSATGRRAKIESDPKEQIVTHEDPIDSLQIGGDQIDSEEIMQQIRARIRARRAEAKARGLDFEAYADGLYPLPPGAILSRDVHEAVRHATLGYDKTAVDLALTETRLPLVGKLAQKLRAALHGLVLFYVNRLAAQQVRFNEQTTRALVALLRDLEAEIGDLRARIAELEAERE